MKIDVIIYVVLFVIFILFLAYKYFVKKEKEWCKSTLYNIQRMVEDYFGTKAGQEKLEKTLIKINEIIDNRCSKLSKFSKWLLKKTLNEFIIKKLLEENMPKINKYGAERKEKELTKAAIDFGIKKGTELLIKEAYNHDVGGNKELTHESQLVTIAKELHNQADEKGFIGAYAEFATNFKEEKELRAGAIAGFKF